MPLHGTAEEAYLDIGLAERATSCPSVAAAGTYTACYIFVMLILHALLVTLMLLESFG